MASNSSTEDSSSSAVAPVTTTVSSTSNIIAAPIANHTSTSTTTATAIATPSSTTVTAAARPLIVPPQPAPPQSRPNSTIPFHHSHQRHQFPPPFTSQHGVFTTTAQRPQFTTKPPSPPVQESIRYPVASSGRGYVSRGVRPPQSLDQTVTIAAGPGGAGTFLSSTSAMLGYPPQPPPLPSTNTIRGFGYGASSESIHLFRPPNFHHSQTTAAANPSTAAKGMPFPVHPHSKAAVIQSLIPDCNGHKEASDKGRDDTSMIVRDRKVKVSDEASLYALCRSWLRNGHIEERQPQFADLVKSLPKPLPEQTLDAQSLKRKQNSEGEEEDEKSAEDLAPEELLQRHVKHAKRVRAQLREERLQRIARYKNRLALLLPPLVENSRSDATPGA